MLLDTNALLWVYEASDRLGKLATESIRSAESVWFSSVSVMEIVVKQMLGRIELPGGEQFPAIFPASGLRELAFSSAHADGMLVDSELVRHDPFDRMLLAQARVERMPLLTSDRTLLALGHSWVFDATR